MSSSSACSCHIQSLQDISWGFDTTCNCLDSRVFQSFTTFSFLPEGINGMNPRKEGKGRKNGRWGWCTPVTECSNLDSSQYFYSSLPFNTTLIQWLTTGLCNEVQVLRVCKRASWKVGYQGLSDGKVTACLAVQFSMLPSCVRWNLIRRRFRTIMLQAGSPQNLTPKRRITVPSGNTKLKAWIGEPIQQKALLRAQGKKGHFRRVLPSTAIASHH